MAMTSPALAGRFAGSSSRAGLAGLDPPSDLAARIGAPRDDAGWLITMSDLSLLLLCLFVVLYVTDRRRAQAEAQVKVGEGAGAGEIKFAHGNAP
jgi:hypothetical protein